MKKICYFTCLFTLFNIIICTPTKASLSTENDTTKWKPQLLCDSLNQMLKRPMFLSSQVSIYIYDLNGDSAIYDYGRMQLMRPASLQKLLTSTAALRSLGSGHEFRTEMYLTGEINDTTLTGNIYLKGGFDPCFNRADMLDFVDSLSTKGIRKIDGKVYCDRSFKDTLKWGEGWCWDDDEKSLYPLLCNEQDNFVEVFYECLDEKGILHPTDSEEHLLPLDSVYLLARRIRNIDQILLPMLKSSINLYAEAMFYQLGAEENNYYPSVKASSKKVYDLISAIGLNPEEYVVADGSGLSLYNYSTAELMVKLLRYIWKDPALYRHIHPFLPVAGVDGTLARRMTKGTACDNVHAKTGTLRGISTLAGYATAADGRQLCFCIMNQGIRSRAQAHAFQNDVCELITGVIEPEVPKP